MRASLPLLLLLVCCPLAHATDPVADLEIHMQIRDHRKLGEFERALELARGLLDAARADSTARDYELVNRGVLVETLEGIVALSPAARSEIQEAERLVDEFRSTMSKARFREGLRLAERQLAIRRRHFGPVHHDVATSLYLCAVAREALGEYAAAEPLFHSALETYIDIVGESSAAVAMSHGGLGRHYESVGNYERSVYHFREIVRLYQAYHWENEIHIARALDDLAEILRKKGNLRTAEVLIRESLAIRERVGEEPHHVAHEVASLASVLHAQGEFAAAEPLYLEALAGQRDHFDSHPEVARTLASLAELLLATGRPAEAAERMAEALDMYAEIYPDPHIAVAGAQRDLAWALRESGRASEADSLFRAAMATYEAAVGGDHPEVGRVHRGLGLLAIDRGDLEEGAGELERALEIHRSALGPDHREITTDLVERGELELQRGNAPAAVVHFSAAVDAYEASRRLVGTAVQRATFQESPDLHLAVARLESGSGDPWPPAERFHGRILADVLFLARGEEPGAIGTFPLERIQDQLDPSTALLGWAEVDVAPGDRRSWGWVLRDTGPVRWVRLAGVESADPAPRRAAPARDLRRALHLAGSWPFRVGDDTHLQALRRRLDAERLSPLVPFLDGVSQLVVVPSGAMVGIPVECLVDEAGRPRGDRFVISYAPSATVFSWLRERATDTSSRMVGPALAIGDPPGSGLSPLPAAADELARVAGTFERSTILVGEEASESELVRLARSGSLSEYRTVHIATHAIVNAGRPERSALVLSKAGNPDPLESALAGERVHDGLLTVEEIVREWRLDASLVTLSGCGTGLGRQIAGEGFFGFAHAFLQVGARSLVLSLWKVDDEATALLMGRFYENLGAARESPEKAAALREARDWLRRYETDDGTRPFAHPAYWSAFVLIGDPH